MKRLLWLGNSYEQLREFPHDVRSHAGYELLKVQEGQKPADWKPMPAVGAGVEEIRYGRNPERIA